MNRPLRVLFVEDNPNDTELVLLELRRAGFDAAWHRVETERDYLERLTPDLDVILSDYELPEFSGPRALELLNQSGLEIPFIIISGTIGEDVAVEAMRQGADDYLLKDRLVRLGPAVNQAIAKNALLRERRRAQETQTAILNALPAHIALVNQEGVIVAVNESWRRFSKANASQAQDFYVGWNYLQVCEEATGLHAEEAIQVAKGLKRVLDGSLPHFAIEYPCHSSMEERWFRLLVSPLLEETHAGAVVMHINITYQRRAQEALQKSEQEQRHLAQQLEVERSRLVSAQRVAKVGSWETDPDTLEVSWSEETHRIFETDPASFEPTHQGFLERVHPDDRAVVDSAFHDSFHRQGPQEIQHRLLMPDGRIKHVMERWQVFHDEKGRPVWALGTCRDITERVMAETEIQRTTSLLRAVADGMPDAVFVKDRAGRYLLFNQGAARLVGKPVEEVIGQDDTALFSPEDARQVMENDRQVMESGKTLTAEEVLTAAGVTRTYLVTKAPYRDGHGNIIGIVGISRDITDRRRAEDKIREQATLLDKARDAILVRDLDHGIRYWNKSAEDLYGWTAQEVLGRKASEILYRDLAAFEKAIDVVLSDGEWSGELQQVTKSGEPILIEGHWTLVRDDAGRPQAILAINSDITEKKRLEQQFLRAQRMESIGTLAGGVAHDLNNVLSPILMSIDLLRLTSRDERSLAVLSTIETSAKRGAEMVKQILSFARGVEGQRMKIDVRQIILDMQHLVQDTFPKNIAFRAEMERSLPLFSCDHTQVHQVLLNLCVNARDAMPHGGTLAVSARGLQVDENYAGMTPGAKPGAYLKIKVTDTGTGIPPEMLDKIFDPFFTTKEVGKGTGLGLSTVLAIVKSHGGFLNVYSEPGNGTTFSIFFPASDTVGGETKMAQENAHPRGEGQLILIVDDEAAVRTITQQTLEIYGYRVLVAEDGSEAVALYSMHRTEVAAVVTDMMMPVMAGEVTIQVLRRLDPDVKIIAASGLANDGSADRAAAMGVKHFLPKPFTAQTILTTLHQV
ncbi:MAG TPA: PAS domain-containing protein, partial [Prosthecobacter sp.]|nr:PAS domain-containing protein [Prosthecobacter sp.]